MVFVLEIPVPDKRNILLRFGQGSLRQSLTNQYRWLLPLFHGYFSDVEVKSLLLKTSYTLNIGLTEYELDLTEKPPCYSLDLIVQEGAM